MLSETGSLASAEDLLLPPSRDQLTCARLR